MRAGSAMLMAGFLTATVSGCASMTVRETANQLLDELSGKKITADNARLNRPHYSIVVPPDRGWHLVPSPEDEDVEGILLKLRRGPPIEGTVRMRFLKIDILSERLRVLSAQEVAEDYRNREKQIMIEEGVNKGEYVLSDVAMGVEQVGEKSFYTMKYTTSASTKNQTAALYLYFPREKDHQFFILAHYSDTLPGEGVAGSLFDAFHEDFLETLKSLSVTE